MRDSKESDDTKAGTNSESSDREASGRLLDRCVSDARGTRFGSRGIGRM